MSVLPGTLDHPLPRHLPSRFMAFLPPLRTSLAWHWWLLRNNVTTSQRHNLPGCSCWRHSCSSDAQRERVICCFASHMVDQHAMRHARMPYASLKRCGKVVSSDSASDWNYPLWCSMLLSGTFLPLSTPPICLLLFFSPRSFLPCTCFALTLERYSCIPIRVCLLGGISLRNSSE